MSTTYYPRVTMLVICYRQEESIDEAINGALTQDYPNLEIVISDDASPDGTFTRIQTLVEPYSGPHHIKLLRNPANLGIGGNIDQAVRQSSGELVFIAAGDDVSLPNRVSTVVRYWMDQGCRPDLIAAYLTDMDSAGQHHGVIKISDLSKYTSIDDWVRLDPPHVIGAAQAWTRRLFDRFNGLPKGVVGEDMVMAFRAIGSGTAVTLPTPLVNYRRGGITSQRKSLSANEVIHGLTRKLKSSQIELRCMIDEARALGASPTTMSFLNQRLDREIFIEQMFARLGLLPKLKTFAAHSSLSIDFRIRILTYAAAPWLLAPFFFIKRALHRLKAR
jgi:glycosyltransferase involved in cell wall biosynthesis